MEYILYIILILENSKLQKKKMNSYLQIALYVTYLIRKWLKKALIVLKISPNLYYLIIW